MLSLIHVAISKFNIIPLKHLFFSYFMKNFLLLNLSRFICFATLFILTATHFSYAQRNRQVVSIGPKVGVNLSDFHSDVANNNIQTGLTAGAMLNYSVVNTFGISVEALFSQKGATFTNAANGTQRLDFNRKLNYIEVPVLARYFLNKSGNFRPNLFIGPDFGFKLSGNDVNRTLTGGAAQADQDISASINPVDVGLTGGIGLNFFLQGTMRLLIDARYAYGFSDINEDNLIGFVNNGRVGNTAITITAGLSFGIGKKYEK
jgi:hypothetical protein